MSPCDNTPCGHNTSTSSNNSVLAGDSSCGSDRGITHFFKATRNTTEEVGEKEQRTNEQYGLGLTQVQEGWFRDTGFPVHLQTNADVHPSRNFHKATRNADSS